MAVRRCGHGRDARRKARILPLRLCVPNPMLPPRAHRVRAPAAAAAAADAASDAAASARAATAAAATKRTNHDNSGTST